MFRKCLACFLMILLLNLQLFAQTKVDKRAEKEAARVAQLKSAMNAIGLGDTSPAELKLKNGGKLVGYISAMKDGSIVFAETALARTTNISYAEIKSIKAYQTPRPSNKGTILGITALAVGLTVLVILGYKHCKKLEREGKVCPTDDSTY
jgi:hypothetical protein